MLKNGLFGCVGNFSDFLYKFNMLKNSLFCKMVILVVFQVFLLVKNLEILIQIVPDSPIYYYSYQQIKFRNVATSSYIKYHRN